MNFRGTRPLPSKIASDFRRQRSVSSDSRVFFLCPCGAEGIKSCLSFQFTARRANLMNGFAGACLKFFFPSHLWLGEKHANRKNGRPLRFLWNLRGPGIGGDPPSAVENRLRFSTADEGPFSFRKRTGFPRLACFFPLPLRGRGNKILPFFPIHGPPRESHEWIRGGVP